MLYMPVIDFAAPAIVRPEVLSGAIIINSLPPRARISWIVASIVFVGTSAILNTPSPTADMSDVNANAGISDGFMSRKIFAFCAKTGPIMTPGFVATAERMVWLTSPEPVS